MRGRRGTTEVRGRRGTPEVRGRRGTTEVRGRHGTTEVRGRRGTTEVRGRHGTTDERDRHGIQVREVFHHQITKCMIVPWGNLLQGIGCPLVYHSDIAAGLLYFYVLHIQYTDPTVCTYVLLKKTFPIWTVGWVDFGY